MAQIVDMQGNPLSTYELHAQAYEWWMNNADTWWERANAAEKLVELVRREHPEWYEEDDEE